MAWSNAIYDRTVADIIAKNSKAFFNVADWIRINGNVKYVDALLNVLRGISPAYTELPEPTISTIPNAADINSFLKNIEAIRVAASLPDSIGIVAIKTDYSSKTAATLIDYEDVNEWEKNLALVREFILKSSVYEVFSGVAEVGQSRYWQARFRTPFLPASLAPVLRPRCGVSITGFNIVEQNRFRSYD